LIKEEDPFECVRCGKPFGVRSSVERMLGKLSGHAMFESEARLSLIRMCDDCRIVAQAVDETLPLAGPPRLATRTTEDYLRERDELRKIAAEAADQEANKKKETEAAASRCWPRSVGAESFVDQQLVGIRTSFLPVFGVFFLDGENFGEDIDKQPHQFQIEVRPGGVLGEGCSFLYTPRLSYTAVPR